jgi:hypothetical protein
MYIAGFFYKTTDFDPSPKIAALTSGSVYNGFFAKYSRDGNYIWAKQISSPLVSYCTGLVLDSDANLYITGSFAGKTDFDPSSKTAYYTSKNNSLDAYFAKYTNSGNYVWAETVGDVQGEGAISLTIDSVNNIYLTGSFSGTVDFGIHPCIANLSSYGNSDIFIAKYAQVLPVPIISIHPQSLNICAAQKARFEVLAVGNNLQYQWMKEDEPLTNNGHISGTTTPILVIDSLTLEDMGNYACIVTNDCYPTAQTTSNYALLSVEELTPPTITTNGQTTFCTGDSVVLTAPGSYIAYHWSNGQTTQSIVVKQNGSFAVSVTNDNDCVSPFSQPVTIKVNTLPLTPQINPLGKDSLEANISSSSYQWWFGNTMLADTTKRIKVQQNGVYRVRIKAENGCYSDFSGFYNFISEPDLPPSLISCQENICIYPNPTEEYLTIEAADKLDTITGIQIITLLGQIILNEHSQNFSHKLNLTTISSGTYLIKITTSKGVLITKVIIL